MSSGEEIERVVGVSGEGMTSPVLIVRRNNRKTPSGTAGGGVVISKSPIHG